MSDRDFLPRFYDPEGKVMLYWQCYMQSAFNRLTDTQHFGLLYNLLRNPGIIMMRCTGLRDKNGKLIYEGDVVKTEWCDEKTIYQVVWDEKMACFCFDGKDIFYLFDDLPADVTEIIGNIHENPEMLEQSNDN